MKITKLIQEHLDQGMHYYKYDDILIIEANNEARITTNNNLLRDNIIEFMSLLGYNVETSHPRTLWFSKIDNGKFMDTYNVDKRIQLSIGRDFIEEYNLKDIFFAENLNVLEAYGYTLGEHSLINYKTYALQTNGSIIGENQTLDIVPFWNEKDMKDYSLEIRKAQEKAIKKENKHKASNFINKHKQIMILKESEIEGFIFDLECNLITQEIINVIDYPLVKKYLEDNFIDVSDDMSVIMSK